MDYQRVKRSKLLREVDIIDLLDNAHDKDWDITTASCSRCGSRRWSFGMLKDDGSISECDVCYYDPKIVN